jgi:hypothetical protein
MSNGTEREYAWSKPSAEDLARVISNERQRDILLRFFSQLDSDPVAMVALKGHLVIEEKITAAIYKFVFHPEHLDSIRFTFAVKLAIARSMSLDRHDHSMWDLISKLNGLRNALSHSLNGDKRAKAMESLKATYAHACMEHSAAESSDDLVFMSCVVALCLGWVDSFEQEIERFKGHVAMLDRIVNPHRHSELE